MSVEFDRESPGKFDSRTLNRKALNRWTGRMITERINVTGRVHHTEMQKTQLRICQCYIGYCISMFI